MRLWGIGKDDTSLCDLTTVFPISGTTGIALFDGILQLLIALVDVNGICPPVALFVASIPGRPTD